ncbi:pterin-4-alpha-carbinolamine dehydratase [Rathayibacter caricis DSM 15933]|uniref:Putative pterin-4-alpha-carbinolamine dehydratase n=1 Tax=Rathayibacter caricis DSM 15933 TaxID=1328867 RepID=A0A2T4USC2_9MICO|nr:VOC family protein [Rathayibacter caricis]PTL72430.1 pterin-4-alpha-carbinolamine dehydratase [Rathayibacter caricis DSM 15933]
MSDRISPRTFRATPGTEGWRVVGDGARAWFPTGSFARGAALVAAVAALADEADHHPDVDLRFGGVGVRLISHDVGDVSRRDAELAGRISSAAQELGLVADPSAVQSLQIAIDAVDVDAVRAFWAAVLGYSPREDADAADPRGLAPNIWVQRIDETRSERNTVHLDLYVPRDVVESRIAAALAAGGRVADDDHAPDWWTLADPEGNEVDLAPWRDDSPWGE